MSFYNTYYEAYNISNLIQTYIYFYLNGLRCCFFSFLCTLCSQFLWIVYFWHKMKKNKAKTQHSMC